MTENLARRFAATVTADPARPLLTWYDDATGERTELSGATLANWVAKTANLLVDDVGLATGDPVAVLLPPHWQTAAVLLGCWSAGAAVRTGTPEPVEALFVAADRLPEAADWPASERYALALAPLAAPLRVVPDGFADYVVQVRGHGDHFTPYAQSEPADADLAAQAARRATGLGITAGDRVLIDTGKYPDPVDWLLAPLVAGATLVLCAHTDPAHWADRRAVERATVEMR